MVNHDFFEHFDHLFNENETWKHAWLGCRSKNLTIDGDTQKCEK